nr:MAG TPA: hypothetical protein [Bacteriophage sp.]
MIQIKKDITIIKCNSTFVYYGRLHKIIFIYRERSDSF